MSAWPRVALGAVVRRPVKTSDPRREPDREFTYIDISSVDNLRKVISSPSRLFGRDAPSRARQVVQAGDILVATTRPNLNAVAQVPPELDLAVCSTGFCVLRPSERVASDFLFKWVQHPTFVGELSALVQGALYPAIRDADVLARQMPLLPLAEQRRIAAQLTDQLAAVDRAREGSRERGRSIGLVRARAYEAAFRGVAPLAVEKPADPAPEPWRWHLLTDLARLESGHTPSRSRPDWWGGDIPWIALPDIRAVDGQVIDDTAEHTNPEGIAHSAARVLPAETVVMSRTASVGFVARMGRPAATSQDFVNWVCGPDLDPEFLMHLLIRSRDCVRGLSSGAIHKTVYFPTVKAFRVCVPPITEQRRIAVELRERLATVDTLTKLIQAELEAIEALPAALLRRAFDEG